MPITVGQDSSKTRRENMVGLSETEFTLRKTPCSRPRSSTCRARRRANGIALSNRPRPCESVWTEKAIEGTCSRVPSSAPATVPE